MAIAGVEFFGLGAGIPVTPWDWSFDLDDERGDRHARRPARRERCWSCTRRPRATATAPAATPTSAARRCCAAIEEKRPRLAVCGHIHESWGCEGEIGSTPVRNLGPTGTWIEL